MFEWHAGYVPVPQGEFGATGSGLEDMIGGRILRRSNLVWQEHCSECAMPSCYVSCDYYRPRPDYKCRRFEDGVELLSPTRWTASPMRLRFGKWARLLAYGPAPLLPIGSAIRQEKRALRNANAIRKLPVSRGLAAPVRRRLTNRQVQIDGIPEANESLGRMYVVIETFVTGDPVDLTFSARVLHGEKAAGELYRTRIDVPVGHHALKIPASNFMSELSSSERFVLEIEPADEDARPEMEFGLLDVVELDVTGVDDPLNSGGPLKCIVWDLDNTLWEGTLIEDGVENLRLRDGVVELIRRLDERGVLNSIASKNNPEDAMRAVDHFGLTDFFLCPQISWDPKSTAVGAIADRLNIGIDALAFIDDQPFERAEVSAVHPSVVVLSINDIPRLLDHPRLQYEVTPESRQRRAMYMAELDRDAALSTREGDYDAFLKSCDLRMVIAPLQEDDIQRVHELAQRTNQLNLSTTRYTRDQIVDFAAGGSPLEAFTIRAEDRFGTYGLVGFCVYDAREALILDLMFSCRIQSKLVDDAFIAWLAEEFSGNAGSRVCAQFRPSAKNSPARQLLQRNGFELVDDIGETQKWERTSSPRKFVDLAEIVTVSAPSTPADHSDGL